MNIYGKVYIVDNCWITVGTVNGINYRAHSNVYIPYMQIEKNLRWRNNPHDAQNDLDKLAKRLDWEEVPLDIVKHEACTSIVLKF